MSQIVSLPGLVLALFVALVFLFKWINVLNEYERAVTFWLGRLGKAPKGPGLVLIFWPFERMVRMSLRTVVHDVPSQDIITRDNVSVKVNAVVYFRVVEPEKAVVQVENYLYATSQLAQTTLRSVLGQAMLDELLSRAREAEPRRSRRSSTSTPSRGESRSRSSRSSRSTCRPRCSGRWRGRPKPSARSVRRSSTPPASLEAAERLSEAAEIIARQPVTLQLRYLQTLTEIASEKNSTIVFPLPIDLIQMFLAKA